MLLIWTTALLESPTPVWPSAKPKFTIDDLPDQTGRVAIVTGSNVGIGKETARVLLKKNCKVIRLSPDITILPFGELPSVAACEHAHVPKPLTWKIDGALSFGIENVRVSISF